MATGMGSAGGSWIVTRSPSPVARQMVSRGGKNSDFHEAGPTAHSNSVSLSS